MPSVWAIAARDGLGVSDGGQVDEVNAILEALDQLGRRLERQPGLSYTAGPGKGQQAHLRGVQAQQYLAQLRFPSDECCGLRRKVVRPAVERFDGREIRLQVRMMELEDVLGVFQILSSGARPGQAGSLPSGSRSTSMPEAASEISTWHPCAADMTRCTWAKVR